MKKLYFITNLHSGKSTMRGKLAAVLNIFTSAGYEVTVRPTQGRLDATAAAEYACLSGMFDLIVCAGGDGTLNEVVQGLMYSRCPVPLGYIPCGSTNDFGRSMKIPSDIEEAARLITTGHSFQCDIGLFNSRNFLYVAAFGAFIETVYDTSQKVKNVIGHLAYLLHALTLIPSIRAYHVKVEYDGEVLEDDFLFGMVSNTASVAGMLKLRNFRLDDGMFEVMLIRKPAHVIQLSTIAAQILDINEEIDTKYVKYFRAKHIRFVSNEEIEWTLDGEFGGAFCETEIGICSRAVTFCVGGDASYNDEEAQKLFQLEQKEASASEKEE
ncbi:MAG: YegS/Rv2252/BmrU family lipid kinase [Oscillospiraceae bacterium]|nr:YegS/Rv2252/BmrU family lipid kinase [Oscillospiraceae bacterium]